MTISIVILHSPIGRVTVNAEVSSKSSFVIAAGRGDALPLSALLFSALLFSALLLSALPSVSALSVLCRAAACSTAH